MWSSNLSEGIGAYCPWEFPVGPRYIAVHKCFVDVICCIILLVGIYTFTKCILEVILKVKCHAYYDASWTELFRHPDTWRKKKSIWQNSIPVKLSIDLVPLSLSLSIKPPPMAPYMDHNWVVKFQPITGTIWALGSLTCCYLVAT